MSEWVALFPGQGSQARGMLDAFASEPVVAETLEEASDVLGQDIARLIAEDPEGRLSRTEYTQPALLTASHALMRLWRQMGGPEPAQAAGHSLGEYSALLAAGCLTFADALRLVEARGRAMAEAVPEGEGMMAAVLGLEDARIEQLCEQCSTDAAKVWPANYNCPGQLVVAGHRPAVERLIEAATSAGAKRALPLAVSVPSHTPLMQPAAEMLAERMRALAWHEPAFPVWSNADAAPKEKAEDIRDALIRQLTSPVRWTEIVTRIRRTGLSRAVEMGPGKVLAGLCRRISRDLIVMNPSDPESMQAAIDRVRG